jgi:RNA polymerase sigma-54 factor
LQKLPAWIFLPFRASPTVNIAKRNLEFFSLKHFFSEGLQMEGGEEVSTREVKKILEDMIAVEDKSKPLSDEFLTEQLKEKGYNIARRTVAKYREQLKHTGSAFKKRVIR